MPIKYNMISPITAPTTINVIKKTRSWMVYGHLLTVFSMASPFLLTVVYVKVLIEKKIHEMTKHLIKTI